MYQLQNEINTYSPSISGCEPSVEDTDSPGLRNVINKKPKLTSTFLPLEITK